MVLIDNKVYTRLHRISIKKELQMKKTFGFIAAAMLLAGVNAFAEESIVIDFTQLEADCVADENGNPTENSRTIMDFSTAAGATFTEDQKDLMKTSLALPRWEVSLNSSARTVQSLGLSTVVAAPVKSEANVPFAGKNVMGVRVVFPEWNSNAHAYIRPPFEIPAYEPLASADENGVRQEPTDEEKASGKTLFEWLWCCKERWNNQINFCNNNGYELS